MKELLQVRLQVRAIDGSKNTGLSPERGVQNCVKLSELKVIFRYVVTMFFTLNLTQLYPANFATYSKASVKSLDPINGPVSFTSLV